jgi:hypothetical protein
MVRLKINRRFLIRDIKRAEVLQPQVIWHALTLDLLSVAAAEVRFPRSKPWVYKRMVAAGVSDVVVIGLLHVIM